MHTPSRHENATRGSAAERIPGHAATPAEEPGPGAREHPAHAGGVHLARAREDALAAMEHAAQWLAIEPSALSAEAYRAVREADEGAGMPSLLSISLLFAGWERAREQVAALSRDNAVVEAEVIRAIYGDPDCRHRAYGTSVAHPKPAPGVSQAHGRPTA